MSVEYVTVMAPRKKKRDPFNPTGQKVVFTEKHPWHPVVKDADGRVVMPAGETFIAEGDVARVAMTVNVRRAIDSRRLQIVPEGTSEKVAAAKANDVDPDSLHNIDLTGPTRAALEAAGVSGISDLRERLMRGRLDEINGISESRVKQIKLALARGGFIEEADE